LDHGEQAPTGRPALHNQEDNMNARMKPTSMLVSVAVALLVGVTVHAQTGPQSPYEVRAFTPAHPDLARSGGVPAELANQEYIEALARLVYYWGYPSVDVMTRTSQWETMKQGPGTCSGSSRAAR
jgi:hypothetical protein